MRASEACKGLLRRLDVAVDVQSKARDLRHLKAKGILPMKKYWTWLLCGWAIVLALFLMGLNLAGLVPLMFKVVLVATVVMVIVKLVRDSSTAAAKATAESAAFAKDANYVHAYDKTAIALSSAERWVRVSSGAKAKQYSFDDVREWDRVWQTGGHLVGYAGSVAGGFAQAGNNARVNRENRAASGLFVHVRDINHPVWRIAFPTQEALLRWNEILRQFVNEGRT